MFACVRAAASPPRRTIKYYSPWAAARAIDIFIDSNARLRGGPYAGLGVYLRAAPAFEVKGKPDWLMRHIFVGLADRSADGNIIRYFALP